MLLESTPVPQVTVEEVPFWLTLAGQLVIGIITAAIPCLFTVWREQSLLKKIKRIEELISRRFDRSSFAEEKNDICKELTTWQSNLQTRKGKLGTYTLQQLEVILVRVHSHSQRIPFDEEDQNIIDSFLAEIRHALKCKEYTEVAVTATGKIEEIKMILRKGAYRV